MSASLGSVVARPAPVPPGRRPSWVVALVDDRLSIELPANSPLAVVTQGACVVMLEGVLHDRSDFVDALRRPEPSGRSDAELVLDAYRSWGAEFVRRIKGHYAALVWDEQSRELIAARDRLGLHPLFYAVTGPAVVLSSSLHALARHPRVSASPNRPALVERLCHRWSFADETYFTQIRRVPPGHVLRRRADDLTVVRYWAPLVDSETGWIGETELERFDDLLDRAIDRALDRGAPAVYLSGGLDSVTIAAVAADECRVRDLAPPLALSLVFPEPASEEVAQRRIARDLGLPQYLATISTAVGPEGLMRSALRMSAESSSPLLNLWAPAYEHLSLEARSRGAATVLTGNGGDEWLTVSPFHAADLLASGDLPGLWRFFRSMHRSNRVAPWTMLAWVLWSYGARPLVLPPLARTLGRFAPAVLRARRRRLLGRLAPRWVAPEPALQRELVARYEQRVEAERHYEAQGRERHYVSTLRRMLDSPILALELEEFFECGRRTGLPLLHPFWDADLVEFLYRVPPRLLNRDGRSKGLVRQSLARRFPGLGFEQHRKLNANEFFGSVLATEGVEAWRRVDHSCALAELGLVEPRGLARRLEQLITRHGPSDVYRLWHLLSVEAWLAAHT